MMGRKLLVFSIIVLMCIVIAGMVGSLLFPYTETSKVTYPNQVNYQVADIIQHTLPAGDRLIVTNPAGRITLVGEERENIELTVSKWVTEKAARGLSRSLLDEIEVKLGGAEDATTIAVDLPHTDGIRYQTDLRISIPKKLVLDLAMNEGIIYIENIQGHVKISNLQGQVKFDGVLDGTAVRIVINNP